MSFDLFLQAVLLGLVEGLTEFLPVSSTGHLILFTDWLGFAAVPGKMYEIVIQSGAILAVCVVYRQKLLGVALNLHREKSAQMFCLNVLVAFLPAAALGVLFHEFIKEHLFNPTVVALALIAGGIAILAIERRPREAQFHEVEDFTPKLSLLVGLVQCVALIPGVSRSGATIMGALMAGADRKAAAEFSFFLAIPTLLGATVYDLYKNWGMVDSAGWELIAVGFVASFISALLVVEWMIGFVSRRGFAPFAWYRIVLGAGILIWTL